MNKPMSKHERKQAFHMRSTQAGLSGRASVFDHFPVEAPDDIKLDALATFENGRVVLINR